MYLSVMELETVTEVVVVSTGINEQYVSAMEMTGEGKVKPIFS
jgi:hypothetical protein